MLSGDGDGSVYSHILDTVVLLSLYGGGVCIAGVFLPGYWYLVPVIGLLVTVWTCVGASTSSFPKPGFAGVGAVVDLGFFLSRYSPRRRKYSVRSNNVKSWFGV